MGKKGSLNISDARCGSILCPTFSELLRRRAPAKLVVSRDRSKPRFAVQHETEWSAISRGLTPLGCAAWLL